MCARTAKTMRRGGRTGRARLVGAAALLVVVLGLFACGAHEDMVGTYYAAGEAGVEVSLALHDGGKGTWTTDEADVPLTWELKGGELWLHTRAGGVLSGAVEGGGVVRMDLPGVGELVFRQVN